MARPRKNKSADAAQSQAKGLVEALDFASVAFRDVGDYGQTHAIVVGKWLYAFDGTIAAGTPIEEDVTACPHAPSLKAALSRCPGPLSLTIGQDGGALTISSGPFRAVVPCVSLGSMTPFGPDPQMILVDDRIKTAFEKLSPLISDSGETVVMAAVRFGAYTMMATNKHTMIEIYHGYPMGIDAYLPKAAINAVKNCKKKLRGYGATDRTATFWFEDGSWIRSQLFQASDYAPDEAIARIWSAANGPEQGRPIPEDFFTAVDTVEPHCTEELAAVRVWPQGISSHEDINLGAAYSLDMSAIMRDEKAIVSPKQLRYISGHVKTMEFPGDRMFFFYGDNLRAAICLMR